MSLNFSDFSTFITNQDIDNLLTAMRPVFRCPPRPHKSQALHHQFFQASAVADELMTNEKQIYTHENLNQLIDKLKAKRPEFVEAMDIDEFFSIRYLITNDFNILFAEEGAPSHVIPGHREMSFQCLAAGNIYFNQDFTAICGLNNQSGDFRPSTESIIWTLIKLHQLELPLTKLLSISLYSNDNQAIKLELTNDELTSLMSTPFIEELLSRLQATLMPQEQDSDNPMTPR